MINKGFVKKINKTTLEDNEIQKIIEELMDTILTNDNLFLSIYEEMIKHSTGVYCCYRFEGSSDFTVKVKDSKKEKFYVNVRIDITPEKC
jgi:hypothetical protein|nr:MAG TPA: hypothetical protein [Caudoviricetes sp.]